MISLANPVWLWALTGLLIPIAVHFLSRKAGKTIPFGSLRFLGESPSSRFRGIRLNEILLLSIRCLAILFLVLFLAGLSTGNNGVNTRLLLVEDDVRLSGALQNLRDSLVKNGYHEKLVSDEAELIGIADSGPVNYWRLIDHLSRRPFNSIVIMSSQRMENFQGQRIGLPENVHWVQTDIQSDTFTLHNKFRGDSLFTRIGLTDKYGTHFITSYQPNSRNAADSVNDLLIRIESSPEFSSDRDILVAALHALGKFTNSRIDIQAEGTSDDMRHDWIISLGMPASSNRRNSILLQMDSDGDIPLLIPDTTRGLTDRRWYLTRRLNIETALEQDLLVELGNVIFNRDLLSKVQQADRRVMPEQMLWSGATSVSSRQERTGPLEKRSSEMLGLFLLAFILERLIARYRQQ